MICHNCKKEIHSEAKFCNHCGTENIKRNRQEEVKYLYRKLAHKFHPDKANGDEELMKKINEAYADGDLETLQFLYYGEKREDIKEPVSGNWTEYRAETEKKAEGKEEEKQAMNDIAPDNKIGLVGNIIALLVGYLLSRVFGLTLIIIFYVIFLFCQWFPEWYSKKKNVNFTLVKGIVWSNLITWIFPPLGFFTSFLAYFFSNNFPNERKKYRTLAVVGIILSIVSAYTGVERGRQLEGEKKVIYETVQPEKSIEDKNKTFSNENRQAVVTPTVTPVVKKEEKPTPKPYVWSCGGTVPYSGKNYKTVKIGSQCWFKENLNVGIMIAGKSDASNNGVVEKYCYDDNAANCATDGGLYQWDEAMIYSTVEGAQGICPNGWHIPKDSEWYTLEDSLEASLRLSIKYPELLPKTEIAKIFNGLLVGFRDPYGSFFNRISYFSGIIESSYGFFWSSSDNNSSALDRYLFRDSPIFNRSLDLKTYGYSIRCLKD